MQAILTTAMLARASLSLRYPVSPKPEAWVIPEGTVPESTAHDAAVQRIHSLLTEWARQRPERGRIARNLAVRWLPDHPRAGIDPDLCVLSPAPAEMETDLSSLCLWKPGHFAPKFCVEVVSRNHPHKDYLEVPDRYASLGVDELFVFDPLLHGPRSLGGPAALQLWRRDPTGIFERIAFGSEPVHSQVLDAWLRFEHGELQIADDRAGTRPWRTEVERQRSELAQRQGELDRAEAQAARERAEKERERAEKERERAEKEREKAARLELERRMTELEAKLRT
jgi:Putative restriction endonuclease